MVLKVSVETDLLIASSHGPDAFTVKKKGDNNGVLNADPCHKPNQTRKGEMRGIKSVQQLRWERQSRLQSLLRPWSSYRLCNVYL